MGVTLNGSRAERDNAGFLRVPVAVPPGCNGAACPAFAICQGRCAVRRSAQRAGVNDAQTFAAPR